MSFEIPTAFIGFIPVFTGILPEDWECDGVPISKLDVCFCNGTLSANQPYTSIVGEVLDEEFHMSGDNKNNFLFQWGLVCEFAWISDSINSIQMVGMLIGVVYSAQLADW